MFPTDIQNILNKYAPNPTPQANVPVPAVLPSPVAKVTTPVTPASKAPPSALDPEIGSIVAKYAAIGKNTTINAQNKQNQDEQDKTLHPGLWSDIKSTVKNIPGAVGEIVTHPGKAIAGLGEGALDFGPSILNSIGHAVGMKGQGFPLPGQSIADHLGDASDVSKAFRIATPQVLGYEAGGAISKGLGITSKLASTVTGNVIGGQLTSEATTPGDRAKQAMFDAAFGAATELGAKGLRMIGPKDVAELPPEVSVGSTEIAPHNPFLKPDESTAVEPLAPEAPSVSNNNGQGLPNTKYMAVKRGGLGFNEDGTPNMAETMVDPKTGNSIVRYDKSLDAKGMEATKQYVIDLEHGHILDKSLNGGENISAELPNYTGNAGNLDKVLGDFSKSMHTTVEDVTTKLDEEVKNLSGGGEPNQAEAFSKAYAEYRADPLKAKETAPTFSALMEYKPIPDKFNTHVTSEGDVAIKQGPMIQTPHGADLKVGESPAPKNVISVNGKQYELSGKSLAEYTKAKKATEARVKSNTTPATLKAEGMKLAALKRRLTGDYTANEMRGLIEKERTNYIGKDVVVKVNGEDVKAKVNSPTAYGNVKVKLADGTELSVKANTLKDPRTIQEVKDGILKREDSKLYKPTVEKPVEAVKKQAPEPKQSKEEPKKNDNKFGGTGQDTGKRVEGRSSFNPDKVGGPEKIKSFFEKMDAENANFDSSRISKSNQDIQDLARMVGLKTEDLINAKPGSIANAETMTAARQLAVNKVNELTDFLKGINPDTASEAQLKDLKDKFLEVVGIQKSIAGLRTEASNVFRSLSIEVAPGENASLRQLAGKLKSMGIEGADALDVSAKIAKEFEQSTLGKAGDAFLRTWYAAILSGPKTTVRNILSTGGNILTDLASKAGNPKLWKEIPGSVSAFFEGVQKGFKEVSVSSKMEKISYLEDRMNYFKEKGMTEDFNKAKAQVADINQRLDTYLQKNGLDKKDYLDESNKFFEKNQDPTKANVFTGKYAPYGRVVESVGRFLNAQDKVLSEGAKSMEAAGLKVYNPEMSDAIAKEMSKFYSEQTVYHGTPKGRTMAALVKGLETIRREAPVTKVIVPFVKTVANVIDRQLDYLPLTAQMRITPAFINRQVENIIKETKITPTELERNMIYQRVKDQQVGRMVFGTGIMAAGIVLAKNGRLSGIGPTNYNEKLQLQQTGWRPNSIKIGDTWVPYSFFGPLSGLLSAIGSVHDKVEYDNIPNGGVTDLIGKGMIGWMQSEMSQSFLSGVSNLMDVLSGNKDYKSYLTQLGAGLVPIPAAYTQTKDMIFDQQYRTSNIIDAVRKNLGLTGSAFGLDPLHPKFDAFGQPLHNDFIFGITPSTETKDQVDQFLVAHDTVVSVPIKNQEYHEPGTVKGKVRLTDDQYDQYVQESGKNIYQKISAQLPFLLRYDDDEKVKKTISNIVDNERTAVRNKILQASKKQ